MQSEGIGIRNGGQNLELNPSSAGQERYELGPWQE